MKTLLNTSIFAALLVAMSTQAFAQQDEQASFYAFNPLHFNPAYAGSRGNFSAVAAFRAQWVGIDGAPQTQFLSAHSPIKAKNMALGLDVCNDKIGARNRTSFYANYAYTLRFKNKGKLNIGVSAGGDMMSVDFNKLKAKDPDETDYLSSFSATSFNVGTGLYYYTDRLYVGLSTPRVMESKLSNAGVVLSNTYIKRHYFLSGGYVIPINSITDLKTSFLLKMTPNAPITLDLNASAFFSKTWWVGAMYRFNESVGVNFAYQHKESILFGYAFDFPINGLSTVKNLGSHEIMVTFDLNPKNKAFGSPRYF